jgi:hypothetical protein
MISSASLALLILLAGRLAGADPKADTPGGGIGLLELLDMGGALDIGGVRPAVGVEVGGSIELDGGLKVLDGRDGGADALGGGGVSVVGVAAAAPAFLLTHFLRFSS